MAVHQNRPRSVAKQSQNSRKTVKINDGEGLEEDARQHQVVVDDPIKQFDIKIDLRDEPG